MPDKPQDQPDKLDKPDKQADATQSRMAETVQGFSAADWRSAQPAKPDILRLTDTQTSPEDKARLVAQLGAAGIKHIELKDKDGSLRQFQIEMEKSGERTLVHLHCTEQDGRDRIVLRAVQNADGSLQQQTDRKGGKVDYLGTWWDKNMSDRSYIAKADLAKTDITKAETPLVANSNDKQISLQPSTVRQTEAPAPLDKPAAQPATDQVNPLANVDEQERLNHLFDGIASRAGYSRKMTNLSNEAVYFRSGMAIDADGSPRARHIDPYGQSRTSLRHTDGRAVNAETTHYYVLPMGKYKQYGVKLGDIAAVRYGDNVQFAVFADVGPKAKLGEGSMALANALGIDNNPRTGGTHRPQVEYIVFPRSGDGTPMHNSAHEDLGKHYLGKAYRRLNQQ